MIYIDMSLREKGQFKIKSYSNQGAQVNATPKRSPKRLINSRPHPGCFVQISLSRLWSLNMGVYTRISMCWGRMWLWSFSLNSMRVNDKAIANLTVTSSCPTVVNLYKINRKCYKQNKRAYRYFYRLCLKFSDGTFFFFLAVNGPLPRLLLMDLVMTRFQPLYYPSK